MLHLFGSSWILPHSSAGMKWSSLVDPTTLRSHHEILMLPQCHSFLSDVDCPICGGSGSVMSLPRSFLLISSNLNSTWCLYLNEENVSQAFRHAEMESTILLQQQTSSNVDTWSKIKSINILLLQGTFMTVSCRVRLCKFQVIKRPGREEFCRCGGIPSKVPRQNPISTIRHIFSSELSREIRTIDALLSPPAALSFSPDSNRTQKLNAVCVRDANGRRR